MSIPTLQGCAGFLLRAPGLVLGRRQAGDLDAVTFVRAAGDDFAKEYDLIAPFANGHVEIFQPRQSRGQFSQFVIMRGKQSFRADLVVQMFDDAPGERKAIKGAGAAADFIQDNQAAGSGLFRMFASRSFRP